MPKERIKVEKVRCLKRHEIDQRGCLICADMRTAGTGKESHLACLHDECPYKVLDKYESYDEFFASEDSMILVPEFFKTAADCYEMAQVREDPFHQTFGGFRRKF